MAEEGEGGSRRILERAFILAVGVGLAWAAWGFWHDRQFPDRFARVQLGMDPKSVEAILGAPDWEGPCTGYGGYLPRGDCTRELGWSSPFALIAPKHYLVQLGREGRVIEAEVITGR